MSSDSYLLRIGELPSMNIRFAFTGAPGAGKTTAAEAIKSAANVKLVDETAVRLLLKYEDE